MPTPLRPPSKLLFASTPTPKTPSFPLIHSSPFRRQQEGIPLVRICFHTSRRGSPSFPLVHVRFDARDPLFLPCLHLFQHQQEGFPLPLICIRFNTRRGGSPSFPLIHVRFNVSVSTAGGVSPSFPLVHVRFDARVPLFLPRLHPFQYQQKGPSFPLVTVS